MAWVPGCVWLTEGELDQYGDLDGDGAPQLPFGADCDDSDPTVNPDTQLDSRGGTTELYRDADQDGFGDETDAQASCVAIAGWVTQPGDCDDADPTVGSTRVRYVDEDGDGFGSSADAGTLGGCTLEAGFSWDARDCEDDDADAQPGVAWYLDRDKDGYGGGAPLSVCRRPTTDLPVVPDGTDCDDEDPLASPGNTERDDPFDGRDSDCKGDTDLDGDGDRLADLPNETPCDFVRDVATAKAVEDAIREAETCLILRVESGEYPGGWEFDLPTVVTPKEDGGVVVFRPPGDGSAAFGFRASKDLTLDRVSFRDFEQGAVLVSPNASLLMGGVDIDGGAGVVQDGPTERGASPTLRILGMYADRVSSIVRLPEPVRSAELLRVSSTGAIGTDPAIELRSDVLSLTSVRITDCAITDDAVRLSAASRGNIDIDTLVVSRCLLDSGLQVDPISLEPTTATIGLNRVRIEDSVFLSSALEVLVVGLRGEGTANDLQIRGNTVVPDGSTSRNLVLVEANGPIELSQLWVVDNSIGSEGSLLRLRDPTPNTLRDSVLAVDPADHLAVAIDEFLPLGRPVARVTQSTIVSSNDHPFQNVARVEDSLVVWSGDLVLDQPSFVHTAFTGAVPASADPDSLLMPDPGFLRFDVAADPALWDLRFTVGTTSCDQGRASSVAVVEEVGGFLRSVSSDWYVDADTDGLLDDWEIEFLGSVKAGTPAGDPDGDGVDNLCELEGSGTLPSRRDTDEDGQEDGDDAYPLDPE